MPSGVRQSYEQYQSQWLGHGDEDAWMSSWWMLASEVGDLYASIIGAPPESVLPLPNATLAMATAASCLDYQRRPKVVTTALDFPSMGYVWGAQRRLGAEITVVPSDDGVHVNLDRLLESIDEQTGIVAVSHTTYCSSHRLDAAAVVRRAHEVGALALLDVYQSAGVAPVDASAWGADFLVGGSIKWLCGGPSCGYLYVRPELIAALEPRLTGWFAHENPLGFEHADIRYDKTIRRFSQGTPSIPALYSVGPGMRIIRDLGVDAIHRESARRTQRIVDAALERGWRVNTPTDASRRGGTVMIGFEDPERVAHQLRSERVVVDWRPGIGIRISPHFFNTDEEIDAAMEIIARVTDRDAGA